MGGVGDGGYGLGAHPRVWRYSQGYVELLVMMIDDRELAFGLGEQCRGLRLSGDVWEAFAGSLMLRGLCCSIHFASI